MCERSLASSKRPRPVPGLRAGLALWAAASLAGLGCTGDTPNRDPAGTSTPSATPRTAFLDTLQHRTFLYFWELSSPATGLTPDRWPSESFSSVAAVGFALTAYVVGAEREYVTRPEAEDRVLQTLEFLWNAPQNDAPNGSAGYQGFFYHFLDMDGGARFEDVELSTVDTALLMAGVLCCQSYFDGDGESETRIRALSDSLYRRVNWPWAQARPPTVSMGWKPETGYLPYDWHGYNEAMILLILALGSPTYPIAPESWDAWTSDYRWGTFYGQEHVGFAPLFGHQYSHVWVDFRGIQDEYMREKGIDYFENSRRATLAQQAYAIDNPSGFEGYGELLWGLTACDGPVSAEIEIDGKTREFHTYRARGASFDDVRDDGTVAPTAAGGSLPFAPEIVIPTLQHMRDRYGEHLYGQYGFLDSFNPTLDVETEVQHGRVLPGVGWFDSDYLGIDQGPIVAMIENDRSGLIWRVMRRNPYIVEGLRRAGFTGGWLDAEGEDVR